MIFSKTEAFRHSSIPTGVAAVEQLATANGMTFESTEDATAFTPENLDHFDAVVFLSTTGDVLDDTQQAAFEDYIRSGGGYMGIHAASDTEYTWPWYGGLVGAYFSGHPEQQTADVHVADRSHPSTEGLPEVWTRFDEWYNFQENPRGDVHVLATLDESTYEPGGGAMGEDHPIAWCQYYDGGRSWYTGGGHTEDSFSEDLFVDHLEGGLLWSAGLEENDCGGTKHSNYQKVVLDDEVASPMGLQIAPDGRVIFIERAGQIRVIDPEDSTTSTAGTLEVHDAQENGLLGIELDPAFATNGWVYLFYTPDSDTVPAPVQRLSRFTMEGDTLDMASESIVLEFPHQRQECCHSGGHLDFGPEGDLWISTGDDTSPGGAPGGYAPIDEREGNEPFDAQRSAANTNDLRGKLLRITPTEDGGYTVPDGNLVDTEWAAGQDTDLIRPEIYAMGLRNPFRFSVDPVDSTVYLADYGPDANTPDPDKGIDGRVEWNIMTRPGNYGWPYCHGTGAYIDYDYATGTAGGEFDCDAPVNDSPNNTGLQVLPPSIDPQVEYGRLLSHPVVGRSGAPMGGPAYQYDPTLESERQWPEYYDGVPIFYEWGQNRLYETHLGPDKELLDVVPMLDGAIDMTRPHELVFGSHDGALYGIEWGSGFGGNNADSQVVRIDYTGGNTNPIANVAATPRSGGVPLTVEFSSAGTSHPQGGDLTYTWDFGDGATSTEENPTHEYTEEGDFTAILTVTDAQERTGTANVTIAVGNTEPDVEIQWPANGTVFTYGDTVGFAIAVDDVEDGTTGDGDIDCSEVDVELILGHDDHGHPMQATTGCEGSFVLEPDGGHVDTDRITYALEARYTDGGSPEGTVEPLEGRDVVAMQPSRKQAEHYDVGDGVRSEETEDPEGGLLNMGFITDGSSMVYEDFNFANIDAMRFRVAASSDGSRIEVRQDSVDGPLLGTAQVSDTGGFQSWEFVETEVDAPDGTFDLVLSFRGGSGYLLNLNWFDFVGEGAAGGRPEVIEVPTATVDPSDPNGSDGWYTDPVTVTLNATDGDAVEYRLDGGEWQDYLTPIELSEDGVHNLDYRAVRGDDTSNRDTLEVRVDGTEPTTEADPRGVVADGAFAGDVRVSLMSEDTTSGVAATEYRLDGAEESVYDAPFVVTGDGEHVVEYRSIDVAGNSGPWRTLTFAAPTGTPPSLDVRDPSIGGVVAFGDGVPFDVVVDDSVDVDCQHVRSRLVVTDGDHVHAGDAVAGCSGTVPMELPEEHSTDDRLRYELEVDYVRGGHDAEVRSLAAATESVRLRPTLVQAEHHDPQEDVRYEEAGDPLGGGRNIGYIRDGYELQYSDVNLEGVDSLRFRLASSTVGGTLEMRRGGADADGELIGTTEITSTGGFQAYEWFDAPVDQAPDGPFTLSLVFRADGSHFIANINMFEFVGDGIGIEAPVQLVEVTPVRPVWSDECGPGNVTGAPLPVVEGVEYVESRKNDGGVKVVATPLEGYVLSDKPSSTKNPDSWTWTKGDSDEDCLPVWDGASVYTAEDRVSFQQTTWEATWWTRGDEPGASPYSSWQEIAKTSEGVAVWTPSRIFTAGDVVVHDGETYTARWWTRNQVPGGSPWGPWEVTS
ncbi:ThuA domain-containing protein [Isoptericola aurantiacus]|uniref:ThuA domain-containing protein n=1 Tax=Isoptericola aurantiacus TaxID=3377839 RepID=UPI00383B712D